VVVVVPLESFIIQASISRSCTQVFSTSICWVIGFAGHHRECVEDS
jgi:hypothetical protein